MVRAGYSPSVRLFEAAACGTPIITDAWPGLETIFVPNEEILLVNSATEVLDILHGLARPIARQIGARARDRVLSQHTSRHRAVELVKWIETARRQPASIQPPETRVLQEFVS
jgi:spore maturation protein CgeB